MRRNKPSSQNGGYNQHRKPRYQQGGHSNGGHSQGGHGQHNRPRRNYTAAREKYLAQARDALAAGDRVMSEYYLQHADHCYRMMMEEGYGRQQMPVQQTNEGQAQGNQPQEGQGAQEEISGNSSQLPAFITANYEQPGQQPKPVDPTTIQNWEDRDS